MEELFETKEFYDYRIHSEKYHDVYLHSTGGIWGNKQHTKYLHQQSPILILEDEIIAGFNNRKELSACKRNEVSLIDSKLTISNGRSAFFEYAFFSPSLVLKRDNLIINKPNYYPNVKDAYKNRGTCYIDEVRANNDIEISELLFLTFPFQFLQDLYLFSLKNNKNTDNVERLYMINSEIYQYIKENFQYDCYELFTREPIDEKIPKKLIK